MAVGALNPVNKSYWLQQVCEDNYRKLLQLLPELGALTHSACSNAVGRPDLHWRLLERTPYTSILELSHAFDDQPTPRLEPAVQIRVFWDAQLAEVLCADAAPLPQRALPANAPAKAWLDYKWRLNYFLQRWLDHCLQQRYHTPTPWADAQRLERSSL